MVLSIMKIIIIIFIVLSSNCFAMDQNFVFEYKSFKNAALKSKTLSKKQIALLNTIKIKDDANHELGDFLIGICNSKENTVLINLDKFINLPYLWKQEIIDHELGHCVLQRSHYNASTQAGFIEIPDSIMYAQTFPYASEEDMVVKRKELFTKEFYGTIKTIEKLGGQISIYELRQLEHSIMAERISKYKKAKP